MEKETSSLLMKLELLNCREEIVQFIALTHQGIKNKLLSQGVEFYEEVINLSQYFKSNQTFSNSIRASERCFYEEVNYIRNGLDGNWVDVISERDRFEPIQKKIKELKYS